MQVHSNRLHNRRSIGARFETSALNSTPCTPYFKILARTLHHLHTLLHLPYTTTLPHTPTLPSRTPHLQETSLPLVGRQPLQVMGEQGSLQVADGHVADVATRVTAHTSHSLGGEGRERRRGKGEGIRGRGREEREGVGKYQHNQHEPISAHHTYLSVYFTSVDTQMHMNTHKFTSPPSLIPNPPPSPAAGGTKQCTTADRYCCSTCLPQESTGRTASHPCGQQELETLHLRERERERERERKGNTVYTGC